MKKDDQDYCILVVEDNPGDLLLIEEFLDEYILKPEIVSAGTYREAEQVIKSEDYSFSAILLDLTLPDKSGEQLINAMVNLTTSAPIIVLTGYTDMSFSVKSLSLGVSDYLLKDELSAAFLYKSIVFNIERQSFTQEIKESEKRFRDLFQLSPLPMFVYDKETLAIQDANQATVDFYGYSESELKNMTIKQLRPADYQEKEPKKDVETRKPNTINAAGISFHQKRNGQIVNVDLRISDIEFKNRDAGIVLVHDVTEQLRHISAIEKQNKKLQEIAWIQSHVVRAPLTRLMSLVELFSNYDASAGLSREEVLEHITTSMHELDDIIRDISSKTDQINLKKP